MKNVLITGGTDGIGKGIALDYFRKGHRVFVIGSSSAKGETLYNEAERIKGEGKITFMQADLSLIHENERIIKKLNSEIDMLDHVILCATSYKSQKSLFTTEEGYEFNFALSYLSRFILSYGLTHLLERSSEPIILNVCAPGMKGKVNFDDVQHPTTRILFHNSRLNDLLGVSFEQRNKGSRIKYILYNPWAVQTTGWYEAIENPIKKKVMKFVYGIVGKSVEEGVKPIIYLLEHPPKDYLTAFKLEKRVHLTMETFDPAKAERLHKITEQLLGEIFNSTQIALADQV